MTPYELVQILWLALCQADHADTCPARQHAYRCNCWREIAAEAVHKVICT
jgi:hypothetical protein